jgi:hypothetical protein
MHMPNLTEHYRRLFDRFGFPLGRSHAVETSALDKTEQRLGHAVPRALRAHYEVAGNERQFNRSMQRFLPPSKWFVDQGRLVFLEENQSVRWWGVSLKSRGAKDPAVYQGLRHDDEIEWNKEHDKCSTFISVILHYQAVSDGFKSGGTEPTDAPNRSPPVRFRVRRENRFVLSLQIVCSLVFKFPASPMPWVTSPPSRMTPMAT